jgi:hypothetical protein
MVGAPFRSSSEPGLAAAGNDRTAQPSVTYQSRRNVAIVRASWQRASTVVLVERAAYKVGLIHASIVSGGCMTTDEKLKLAVSVARAAARSGEYRRLDKLIEIVFRKLNELAPPEVGELHLHEHDREFKL